MKDPIFKYYIFILYIFLCIVFAYSGGLDIAKAVDYHFYFTSAFTTLRHLGFPVSSYATHLYDALHFQVGWQATPFYSTLAYFGFILSGNLTLFFAQGVLLGLFVLHLVFKFLSNIKFATLPQGIQHLLKFSVLIGCLYPSFVFDTALSSPTSYFFCFLLLALNSRSLLLRSVFLALSALVRPTYILIPAAFFVAYYRIYRTLPMNIIVLFLPSLVAYYISYLYFYSHYPGSAFTYILSGVATNSHSLASWEHSIFSDLLSTASTDTVMDLPFSFETFLNLFAPSWEKLTYFLALYSTKLANSLGGLGDELFISRTGLWFLKSLRLFYFYLLLIPGFYLSARIFIHNSASSFRLLNDTVLLFVLFHSLLISVPRYFIILHFYFIFLALYFWFTPNSPKEFHP